MEMKKGRLLDQLAIITDEEDDSKWVNFEKFIEFLKTHLSPLDNVKEIRKDNILRSLQKDKNAVRQIKRTFTTESGHDTTVETRELNLHPKTPEIQ